jgi:hypothetical protein
VERALPISWTQSSGCDETIGRAASVDCPQRHEKVIDVARESDRSGEIE